MVVCYFAPESPWWLVRAERLEQAKQSIKRLSGGKTEEQINNQVAMMVHTNKVEAEETSSATYLDCFKGVNLRRTEIVCVVFAGQILSGSSFAYTPTYFFTSAGLPTSASFYLSLGAKGFALIGTLLSVHFPWGDTLCCANLTSQVLGPYYTMGSTHPLSEWHGYFITGFAPCRNSERVYGSVGPLGIRRPLRPLAFRLFFNHRPLSCEYIEACVSNIILTFLQYSIISETSSVRLRPLSVVLARVAYQVVNIVSQFLNTYMINPVEWNWSGKSGFFWGGTAFLVFVWSFFRLPEVKDRTYEELDILFMKRISARKFASTHVDAYETVRSNEKLDVEMRE